MAVRLLCTGVKFLGSIILNEEIVDNGRKWFAEFIKLFQSQWHFSMDCSFFLSTLRETQIKKFQHENRIEKMENSASNLNVNCISWAPEVRRAEVKLRHVEWAVSDVSKVSKNELCISI